MRRHGWLSLLLAPALACSSGPPKSAGPPPTPEPTIRPLPEPVVAKVREVYPTLARELALAPDQEARVRTHLENAIARVYQLSIVPLTSEKGRQQMVKMTLDQFDTDMLGTLTDEQLPKWDAIRASTRRSMSRITLVTPTPAVTPAPPSGGSSPARGR